MEPVKFAIEVSSESQQEYDSALQEIDVYNARAAQERASVAHKMLENLNQSMLYESDYQEFMGWHQYGNGGDISRYNDFAFRSWEEYCLQAMCGTWMTEKCPTVKSALSKLVCLTLGDETDVSVTMREEREIPADLEYEATEDDIKYIKDICNEVSEEFLNIENMELMMRRKYSTGEIIVAVNPMSGDKPLSSDSDIPDGIDLWIPDWHDVRPLRALDVSPDEVAMKVHNYYKKSKNYKQKNPNKIRDAITSAEFGVVTGRRNKPRLYMIHDREDVWADEDDVNRFMSADWVHHFRLSDSGSTLPRGCPPLTCVKRYCDRIEHMSTAGAQMIAVQAANAVVFKIDKPVDNNSALRMSRGESKQKDKKGKKKVKNPGERRTNMQLQNNPISIGASDIATMITMAQRTVGAIIDVPDFMTTSDSGTGNRSNFAEIMKILDRRVKKERRDINNCNNAVYWLAIRAKSGWSSKKIEDFKKQVEVKTNFPTIENCDISSLATASRTFVDMKAWSVQEVQRRTNVNPEQMRNENADFETTDNGIDGQPGVFGESPFNYDLTSAVPASTAKDSRTKEDREDLVASIDVESGDL